MSKRASKLKALQQLLQHREDLAQRRLGQRRQAVEAACSKAQELDGLQREYHERLSAAGDAGLRASDLRLWRRFTASMGDVVDVQQVQVERLQTQLEEAQQAWLAAHSRRKGGELLEETQQRREAASERRRERVESADAAGRRNRDQDA